jgi:hypothetical protein
VSALISTRISELDAVKGDRSNGPDKIDEDAEDDVDPAQETTMDQARHVSLGADQRPRTIADIEEENSSDPRFRSFQTRLARFFNTFLPAHNIPFPDGQPIKFRPTDLVSFIFSC